MSAGICCVSVTTAHVAFSRCLTVADELLNMLTELETQPDVLQITATQWPEPEINGLYMSRVKYQSQIQITD